MWAALLAIGALVALLISWPIKSARLWIAIIMAGFFLPRYWDLAGIGQIYILNLLVDCCICLVIERYATKAWELKLFKIYKLSAATSLLFFAGHIGMTYISVPSTFGGYLYEGYGILLEAFNWTALALIAREGWPEFNGRLHTFISRRPDRQAVREALRAPRQSPSWQRR